MFQTTGPHERTIRPYRSPVAVSLLIHAISLAVLTGILHRHIVIAPNKLPGTRYGIQLLTYYSPGSTNLSHTDVQAKQVDKRPPTQAIHSPNKPPKTQVVNAASTQPGIGTSGESGLGDGNIVIALPKFFPHPSPSLATLRPGSSGDVILDAVIDEHGKIVQLTLLQGLGPDIDNQVIQTVNQWTYTPATKNGVPVQSAQELHFHYERRG